MCSKKILPLAHGKTHEAAQSVRLWCREKSLKMLAEQRIAFFKTLIALKQMERDTIDKLLQLVF
jgi:hypothetical protein